VGVTLQRFDHRLQVTVEDDGPGFDVEAAQERGRLGLAGMRERAAACGGTLEIESSPGQGTTVYLRIPAELLYAVRPVTHRPPDTPVQPG
ncbi:MAG: ATP-binding protein, partial [Armatimonadota bacterium]